MVKLAIHSSCRTLFPGHPVSAQLTPFPWWKALPSSFMAQSNKAKQNKKKPKQNDQRFLFYEMGCVAKGFFYNHFSFQKLFSY